MVACCCGVFRLRRGLGRRRTAPNRRGGSRRRRPRRSDRGAKRGERGEGERGATPCLVRASRGPARGAVNPPDARSDLKGRARPFAPGAPINRGRIGGRVRETRARQKEPRGGEREELSPLSLSLSPLLSAPARAPSADQSGRRPTDCGVGGRGRRDGSLARAGAMKFGARSPPPQPPSLKNQQQSPRRLSPQREASPP